MAPGCAQSAVDDGDGDGILPAAPGDEGSPDSEGARPRSNVCAWLVAAGSGTPRSPASTSGGWYCPAWQSSRRALQQLLEVVSRSCVGGGEPSWSFRFFEETPFKFVVIRSRFVEQTPFKFVETVDTETAGPETLEAVSGRGSSPGGRGINLDAGDDTLITEDDINAPPPQRPYSPLTEAGTDPADEEPLSEKKVASAS